MGSTLAPLKVGDPPTERLKAYRRKYGGAAELRARIEAVVESRLDLNALVYVLKHRPPKDLKAIEDALLAQSADVENALAHIRRMRALEEMPVSTGEYTSHEAELVEILRGA